MDNTTLSTTHNTTKTTALLPRRSIATLALLFVFSIGFFIFIVNSIVFTILLIKKKLRSGKHTFIFISLSFSDAMFGVSLVAISAEPFFSLTDGVMCPVWLFLAVLPMSTSLCQTLVICIDRFVAIQTDAKYRNMFSGKKKYTATAAVWVINILYFLITFLSLVENQKTRVCSDDFLFGSNIRLFKIAEGLIIIPVYILTIVFYVKLLIALRRRLQAIGQNATADAPVPVSAVSKKNLVASIKTTSIVVVALLILMGPLVIEIFLEIFTSYNITQYVKLFPIFNALANPVVYLWRVREFRMAVSCGKWT